MTLAKALKTKNRLAQKIAKLQREIQKENSTRIDDPRKLDVNKLMETLNKTVEELLKLKLVMFVASTPIRENIFRLSELKSKILFLQSINIQEGITRDYDGETEYSVAYDKIWVRDEIQRCEDYIDEHQDTLDKFNHITEIKI